MEVTIVLVTCIARQCYTDVGMISLLHRPRIIQKRNRKHGANSNPRFSTLTEPPPTLSIIYPSKLMPALLRFPYNLFAEPLADVLVAILLGTRRSDHELTLPR